MSSARAAVNALLISPRMCRRPSFACASATFMISSVIPAILMCCRDMLVPATLKSMSPRWSSSPRMSEEHSVSFIFKDEAHGDAGRRPLERYARVHQDSDEPQTVAIDEEPFDSVISRRGGWCRGIPRPSAASDGSHARRAFRARSHAGQERPCDRFRQPNRAEVVVQQGGGGLFVCCCPAARRLSSSAVPRVATTSAASRRG